MNNCSCNKKYLGEGCIELPSEFGTYFLLNNFFKELDTEEKRNIARINLGIDLNKINQINKVIPLGTSETNKLVNKTELQQVILEEANVRETKYNELNNKIPVFTNNQLETLNSGITNKDKQKLDNIELINLESYISQEAVLPNVGIYMYDGVNISPTDYTYVDAQSNTVQYRIFKFEESESGDDTGYVVYKLTNVDTNTYTYFGTYYATDNNIPYGIKEAFHDNIASTLYNGLMSTNDKAKLDNAVENINIANYLTVGTLMPSGAFYNYNNLPISSRGLAVLDIDLDITGGIPGDVTECIVFCRYDKDQESVYGTEYYAFTFEINGLQYVKSWLHNVAPQYIKNAFGEYSNVTTTYDGLMSKEDKQKLDNILKIICPKDQYKGEYDSTINYVEGEYVFSKELLNLFKFKLAHQSGDGLNPGVNCDEIHLLN